MTNYDKEIDALAEQSDTDPLKKYLEDFKEKFRNDSTAAKKIRYVSGFIKSHYEGRRDILSANFILNACAESIKRNGYFGTEKSKTLKGDTVLHKINAVVDFIQWLLCSTKIYYLQIQWQRKLQN